MASKYYVVWRGRNPGIFSDWEACRQQVDKFPGARFKSFPSMAQAEAAFAQDGSGSGSGSALSAPAAKRKAVTTTRDAAAKKTIKTWSAVEVDALTVGVKIFTDGACEPNPGKAGSGIALYRNQVLEQLWYGLYNPQGTNNTAELQALHQAMLMAERESTAGGSVAIFCDSKYSIQCVTQWAVNWQKKGWKKAGGEIKNLELIKKMFALHQSLGDEVQVLHVNGHVGVQGNELADRMSMLAIQERREEFVRYQDALDIEAILRWRAG